MLGRQMFAIHMHKKKNTTHENKNTHLYKFKTVRCEAGTANLPCTGLI